MLSKTAQPSIAKNNEVFDVKSTLDEVNQKNLQQIKRKDDDGQDDNEIEQEPNEIYLKESTEQNEHRDSLLDVPIIQIGKMQATSLKQTQDQEKKDRKIQFLDKDNIALLEEQISFEGLLNKQQTVSIAKPEKGDSNFMNNKKSEMQRHTEDELIFSRQDIDGILDFQEGERCISQSFIGIPQAIEDNLSSSEDLKFGLYKSKKSGVFDILEEKQKIDQFQHTDKSLGDQTELQKTGEDCESFSIFGLKICSPPVLNLNQVSQTTEVKNSSQTLVSNNIIKKQKETLFRDQTEEEEAQIEEASEELQKDEFTLMFQSNCPIKSPIIPRKKKIEIPQQITQPLAEFDFLDSQRKDRSLLEINSDTKKKKQEESQTDCLKHMGITLNENSKKISSPKKGEAGQDQTYKDQKTTAIQITEDQDRSQHFQTDIKSVRNHKVNAFRSKLSLHSQGNQLQPLTANSLEEEHGFKKQTPNSALVTSINEHNSEINTKNRLNLPPLRNSLQNAHDNDTSLELTNEQDKSSKCSEENNCIMETERSNFNRGSRRFKRTLLRIKVDPQNPFNQPEENSETWDELVSSDQVNTEVAIEPKARQGCSNFEDMYTLLDQRQLGEGTSGCVYQCIKKNSDDETVYAVKVMRNVDDEMSKSIFQTFGVQYRLQHEFVSRVYEVYYNENSLTLYYVTEYIPFRSLDVVMRERKMILKETESSSIVQKLLKAVCYMERRGVCHRDLKPENILISEDLSQLKIIDFGVSKSFVKSQRVQHITQYYKHKMYTPTGTPSYKAPEILQGVGYTQLVDMWAIGVIAYQLICRGRHPFKCDTQIEQDKRILSQHFNQNDEAWIKSSQNAKNFIKQLLRHNRFPAFEALKHPWIEQRKIEVPADDEGRNVPTNLEKKQQNDAMTISVPVHFQPRTFNLQAISSDQIKSSGIGAADESAIVKKISECTNKLNNPYGTLETSAMGNAMQVVSQSLRNEEEMKKNSFQQTDETAKMKKKHFIQGFASTQDVVHVVMRQKFSESRDKMMQFFLKANSIIRNLEEEQHQLEQQNPQSKTLKRTHSVEKKAESTICMPSPQSEVEDSGIIGIAHTFSQTLQEEPFASVNKIQYRNNINRYHSVQSSIQLNIAPKNVKSTLNLTDTQCRRQSAMTPTPFSESDLNKKTLEQSLLSHKAWLKGYQSKEEQLDKRITRRNSSETITSMEKSLIFIKDVIGELQESFSKENTEQDRTEKSSIDKITAPVGSALSPKFNLPNIREKGNSAHARKTSIIMKGHRAELKEKQKQNKVSAFVNNVLASRGQKLQNISKEEEEKWRLIAENMDLGSQSDLEEKLEEEEDASEGTDRQYSSNSSSPSSVSSSKQLNYAQSFVLDGFLIKDHGIEDTNLLVNDPQNQQINEQSESQKIDNNLPSSIIPKNNDEMQDNTKVQGIFTSIPYTNYLNSSKHNVINQSLIELQIQKDSSSQPNIVRTLSKEKVPVKAESLKILRVGISAPQIHQKQESIHYAQVNQTHPKSLGMPWRGSISGNFEKNFENEKEQRFASQEMYGQRELMEEHNLSFVDMNQSNLVHSPNLNSLRSMNMNESEMSSINIGNLSQSGSSSNTLRSLQAMTFGESQAGVSDYMTSVVTQGGHKDKISAIKLKCQPSDNNSSSSSNSQLKRPSYKMNLEMSVSQQISSSDFHHLQNSAIPKVLLDASALNSSSDATTPRKQCRLLSESVYQASNMSNECQNSSKVESNCPSSSPKQPLSPRSSKQSTSYIQEHDSDPVLSIPENNANFLQKRFSIIIEEPNETRSFLTNSIAASVKFSHDVEGIFSSGIRINNKTKSLSHISQSNSEKNDASLPLISTSNLISGMSPLNYMSYLRYPKLENKDKSDMHTFDDSLGNSPLTKKQTDHSTLRQPKQKNLGDCNEIIKECDLLSNVEDESFSDQPSEQGILTSKSSLIDKLPEQPLFLFNFGDQPPLLLTHNKNSTKLPDILTEVLEHHDIVSSESFNNMDYPQEPSESVPKEQNSSFLPTNDSCQ